MKRRIEVTLVFEVESKKDSVKDGDQASLVGFLSGVISNAVEKLPTPFIKILHWEWKGSKVLP